MIFIVDEEDRVYMKEEAIYMKEEANYMKEAIFLIFVQSEYAQKLVIIATT